MTTLAYGRNTEHTPSCPHCGGSLTEPASHGIDFHADSGIVIRNRMEARLTPMQLMMLECFLDRYPRVVSEYSILHVVDEVERNPDSNSIKVQISRMRRKLEPLGIRLINKYGFGWHLELESDAAHGINLREVR